jgi:hypothetical protein
MDYVESVYQGYGGSSWMGSEKKLETILEEPENAEHDEEKKVNLSKVEITANCMRVRKQWPNRCAWNAIAKQESGQKCVKVNKLFAPTLIRTLTEIFEIGLKNDTDILWIVDLDNVVRDGENNVELEDRERGNVNKLMSQFNRDSKVIFVYKLGSAAFTVLQYVYPLLREKLNKFVTCGVSFANERVSKTIATATDDFIVCGLAAAMSNLCNVRVVSKDKYIDIKSYNDWHNVSWTIVIGYRDKEKTVRLGRWFVKPAKEELTARQVSWQKVSDGAEG